MQMNPISLADSQSGSYETEGSLQQASRAGDGLLGRLTELLMRKGSWAIPLLALQPPGKFHILKGHVVR